jgi:hypothetical protein
MRNIFAAALCMLVFTTNGEAARRLDPEVARLPRCTMKELGPGRGWTGFGVPETRVRLRIPPGFAAAPQQFLPPHRGFTWRDSSERELRVKYGHWSVDSFAGEQGKCLLRMRRMDAVIVTYEASLAAWLIDSGKGSRWSYDLLLSMSGARAEDRELFLKIVGSAGR